MKGRRTPYWKEQRGIVLIVAMLVMAVLSVLALAFLATARTEDTIAVNYRNHTAAFYAAEAGLESGVSSLKSILGGGLPTQAQLDAIVPATLSNASYTFDTFQIQQVRPTPYNSSIATGPYVGLNAQFTPFEVTASVTGPRGSRARMSQTVYYTQIPLFQFAIFYGRGVDLNISPNPPSIITGRVHSNSNLYLSLGQDLKFDGRVTTAGNVYRHSPDTPPPSGPQPLNPEIKDASGNYQKLNFDHELDYDFNNPWAASDWKNAALSTFGGTLQDSAMGVGEILPPIPSAFYDPAKPDVSSHQMIESANAGDSPELKAAKLQYQADLIIVDESGYDQAGNPVDVSKCKGAKGAKAVEKKSFYDPREQKDITVTEIDVGLLNSCGLMPANGVMYTYRTGTKPKKGYGIRLKNGAELPPQGLTVASEDPVYIMGDYNTKNKVPAAVMGDAIYALSNNWEKNGYDTKGKSDVSSRPAADTTINAALMMGFAFETDPVPGGEDNGGHQNLIRLLEDWRSTTPWPDSKYALTLTGSIVSLWHSLEATTHFSNGTKYRTPPRRPWSYDPLFDTQLPPGTPMGIIVTRGQWSQG
jgi:hypothetical protein